MLILLQMRYTGPFCNKAEEEQTRGSCVLRIIAAVLGAIVLLAGILALGGIPGVHALGVAGGSVLTAVGIVAILAGLFLWRAETFPATRRLLRDYNKKENKEKRQVGLDAFRNILTGAKTADRSLPPYQKFYYESHNLLIWIDRVSLGEDDAEKGLLNCANALRNIILNPPGVTPNRLAALHARTFGDATLFNLVDDIIPLLEDLQNHKTSEKTEGQLRAACEKARAIVEQFKPEEFDLSISDTNKNLGQARSEIKSSKGNAKSSAKVDPQLLPYQKFYRESQNFINWIDRVSLGEEGAETSLLSCANRLRDMLVEPPEETPKHLTKLHAKTFGNMTLLDLLHYIIPIFENYQKEYRKSEQTDGELRVACQQVRAIVEQFKPEEFGL